MATRKRNYLLPPSVTGHRTCLADHDAYELPTAIAESKRSLERASAQRQGRIMAYNSLVGCQPLSRAEKLLQRDACVVKG